MTQPSPIATPVPRRSPARRLLLLSVIVAAAGLGVWWGSQERPATQNTVVDEGSAPEANLDATLSDSQRRAAYSRVLPPSQRLRFIEGYSSYAGVDELLKRLYAAGLEPVHSQRHQPVPRGIPANNSDTIRVANFQHLGVNGTLELQFFNDRLCQLEFEPEDAKAYLAKFRAQWPDMRREKNGRSERISGALRMASSLDLAVGEVGQALQTRPFVLWQDLRLIRQRDAWDAEFAVEAAR